MSSVRISNARHAPNGQQSNIDTAYALADLLKRGTHWDGILVLAVAYRAISRVTAKVHALACAAMRGSKLFDHPRRPQRMPAVEWRAAGDILRARAGDTDVHADGLGGGS